MSTRPLTGILSLLNSFQRVFASHVLLYHATYGTVPQTIQQRLHNVTPEVLFAQVQWLQKYFDIVEVEQLFHNVSIAGKVAITFDDAYQSVFDEALPVMKSLNVPCTIFVNGISLSDRPFWRDKVRYLIAQSLVKDFLHFSPSFTHAHHLTVDNFYRMTKHQTVNSAALDAVIDQYLNTNHIQLEDMTYCVNDRRMLIDHPLVSYGNHTYHHYVLSSLSKEQQEEEIVTNHRLLEDLTIKASRVFAVPFGGEDDFNVDTLELLKQYGYRGFLYSKGAINVQWPSTVQQIHGMRFRDRYMVEPSFDAFQRQMLRLCKNNGLHGMRSWSRRARRALLP